MHKDDKIKILFVSTEVSPYSKSGGLGDVAGSLPQALRARGADVRVCFPKYGSIAPGLLQDTVNVCKFTVHLSWRSQEAVIHALDATGTPAGYLIENGLYFDRETYYGYGDDFERFAFFAKASVEMLSHVDFQADIIHFNDWQTGLGCTYLRDVYSGFTFYSNMKSLFTIHNLHYQGIFGREVLWNVGLNDGYFTNGDLEFFNNVSLLKAGVMHADAVSTVSETYAKEIQTPAFGFGMDGLLGKRGMEHRLFGITNGIDVSIHNPETDPKLYAHFNVNSMEGKKQNKLQFQKDMALPERDVPMFAIVSRLTDQKGLDLIAVIMEELINKDVQFVVLGTGEGRYENLFRTYEWQYHDKVRSIIGFNAEMAQRIYAAADMYLMPSLYEPCGLSQLFAMRYGTVPIVRKTGGLADTVHHFNAETKEGNGFVFEDYVASGLMWAIDQALNLYYTEDWAKIVRNAMSDDYSWDHAAGEYVALYKKIINEEYN